MSNNRDNSPELDFYELRRRHEQYKNRANRPAPSDASVAEELAREMHKQQPVKKAENRRPVEEPKKAVRRGIPADEIPEKEEAFDEDAFDQDFDIIDEDIDEEEVSSADDMYENPNPFDSFIRFFNGVKSNKAAKRGRKAAETDFEDEDFDAGMDDAENAPRRAARPAMVEDEDFEGDDSAAEDIADSLRENAPRASRYAAQDDGDEEGFDDEDLEDEDDAPRGAGFKKFISLFVTRIDEEEEEEEDEDEEEDFDDEDFEDDSEEDFVAAPAAPTSARQPVYSKPEGGLEMDEMNRPVSAGSAVAEGLETSGMSRRERRELAMRLAAEEAARKAAQEADATVETVAEEPAVESVYEAAAEATAPAAEEQPAAEIVEEPTREFKPVSLRKAEPEEDLFDLDDDEDDEEEEEVKKPRRGLFGRRKKVVEEDDEDEDDEDDLDLDDEDDEDEEEEVKPRRGLFGRRKKVVEEDDEDEDDDDEYEDDDDESDEEEFGEDFDEYDEYDDDDEDDEDEDEYDDDEDDRRSFGHHLLGALKAVLGIVLLLLVVILVLNFLYIGGNGAIVETLHDKMGDSPAFSVLFPSYAVRESMPEEVIEPEITAEPIVEAIEVPEVEAGTVIPSFDTGAETAPAIEEPVVEAAPVVIEEAPAAIG